ncbi:putative tetratricopeptide-like helical domain superfamily [Helianthus annuus]|nr:putative tetratricopeptide-like helical domain superfamily [Helianthus annuus]
MVGLRSCKLYDRPLLSRVFFSSLSSEQTASIGNGNVVYKMLSPAELRPWASVVPILDQWILEGNHINVGQLRNMVKVFRNYNRYSQALQLYEWMTQRSYLEKSSGNMAVHLDLISRVYGLQQAEKYFNTIPDSLKDFKAMENLLGYMETNPDLTLDWHLYIIAAKGYLNFGQNDKCLEMLKKTEQSVHEKTNGVAYEILLTMYANLAKKDHVYRIWDLYKTACRKVNNKMYHHMASSLVKLDDIEGAEKILTEWESKTTTSFDFWVVNVLVNGYSRKGDWKKAEDYVERLVGMGKQPPKSTWDCLATAYCKYEEMEKAVEAMKKAISCIDDDRWSLNQVTLIACVRYLENKGDMKVAKEFARLTEGLAESANNSTVGLAVNSSG